MRKKLVLWTSIEPSGPYRLHAKSRLTKHIPGVGDSVLLLGPADGEQHWFVEAREFQYRNGTLRRVDVFLERGRSRRKRTEAERSK